jgi:predicted PurR-regulated permease PerM
LIKDIIIIVGVAVLFAMALNPIVDWMHQTKRIPRSLGIAIIYILLFVTLFGSVAMVVPALTAEVGQIAQSFPTYWQRVQESFSFANNSVPNEQLVESFNRALGTLNEILTASTQNVFAFIGSVFGNIVTFIFIFVLAFYMLIQESAIRLMLKNITPEPYRAYVSTLITRMQERISQWLRAQLILSLVVGLLTLVGLIVLRVKFFLVLALLAGIMEIIPYLGPVLAAVPAIFIAFAESPVKGLAVLVLCWLIQQLENHVIVPKVMQKVVGLNPIVIIVVLLIGAQLAGFIGVIVSVPVAAALSVLVKDIVETKDFYQFKKNRVPTGPPEV